MFEQIKEEMAAELLAKIHEDAGLGYKKDDIIFQIADYKEDANSMILECRNLSKTFLKKKAVVHFNVALQEGKIYGLLGENGSGKNNMDENDRLVLPNQLPEISFSKVIPELSR